MQTVPIEKIHESQLNTRKNFGDLTELTASVKAHGVLQPITVRPRNGGFDVVFGARRLRAAKAAKLGELDVIVRELSDEEALELVLVENLQRADIHPLEEAEGYRQLHEVHKHAVEDIAAKVGKSKAYVYARLKLCELVPAVREACFKGKLPTSHALLIARIPNEKLQREALESISHGGAVDEPLGYRAAADIIQRQFMLRLEGAPFALADAALVPEAGACTTCPKRTGNQRELFSDVKSADVCTDPPCFAKKRDAAWADQALALEQQGHEVLSGPEAKKTVDKYGHLTQIARDRYVDLDEHDYRSPGSKKIGELLGKKHGLRITVARADDGRVRQLVDKKSAQKIIRERHDWAKPAKSRTAKAKPASPERAIADRASELALAKIVRSVESKGLSKAAWLELVLEELDVCDGGPHVAARRGLETGADSSFVAYARTLGTIPKLQGLFVELRLTSRDGCLEAFRSKDLLAGFGVKVDSFKAEAKKLLAAEAKAAKTAPKKAKAAK